MAPVGPRHNASCVSTPGSVPRRETIHPLLAVAAMVVGVAGMPVPIWVAQLAAARGHALGLRPLLMASELMLVVPAVLLLVSLRRPLAASLALGGVDRTGATVAVCAGAALWAASVGLMEMQSIFWPPSEAFLETFRVLHAALQPKNAFDAAVSVLAIAVFPAVCEEILFRGVVLPSLARLLGAAGAVLGSALLFGAIHYDAVGGASGFTRVPFAIAVGIGLGLLRVRTGSLVAPILAHAVLNTITFATVLALGIDTEMDNPEPLLSAVMLVGGTALAAIALRHARPPLTPPEPAPRLGR